MIGFCEKGTRIRMANITAAITTLDDFINYGNRLQKYLFTKLLQNEGFKVYNGIEVLTKEEWVIRTNGAITKLTINEHIFQFAQNKALFVHK